MPLRKAEAVWLVLVLLSVALAAAVYDSLPSQLATHWNARGEADGHMPRFWGLALFPLISLGLVVLFWAIPRVDPWRRNFSEFLRYYDVLVVLLLVFLLAVQVFVITWNLGWRFHPAAVIAVGVGCLVYYTGVVCAHARPNWFVGVRTPWTLVSESVWYKTHKRAAPLLKAAGIVAMAGAVFPNAAVWLVLFPVFAVAVYTVAYSYWEYRRETEGS
ncbi:MAG: SdpI family protein [Bryobacterales bacterium]|nr:SdpI family protein [Bryobacteraceae bacterium]MDW8355435.1 SdpI family protein [Bryobacterales bacterium]